MTNYDAFTRVSNNQSLIGLPLALSDSSIQIIQDNSAVLTVSGRDIGRSADLAFRVHVTQEFDGAVASLAVSVVMAADEALATGTVIGTTTIPLSGLALGNEFDVRIPSLSESNVTGVVYLGLLYIPSAVPTTGKVSAWLPLGDSPGKPRRLAFNYTGPS